MKINVIKKSLVSLLIALAIMAAGLAAFFIRGGLNLGVDFTGGQLVTLQFDGDYETEDIQKILDEQEVPDTTILRSDENRAVIRMPERSEEEQSELNEALIGKLNEDGYKNVSIYSIDRVGATASRQLILNAILSVSIAGLLILIYIWIRFELYSGIAAVLALVHDVLIMLSFVAIFNVPINSSFIAAVLTIIGYSINSTILVFDQLRENTKLYGKTMSSEDLINKSIADTFWRSVFTSLTTLITVTALYFLGVDSIKEFTLPIIVGLFAGAFSSIVLAGQWWYFLKIKAFHQDK